MNGQTERYLKKLSSAVLLVYLLLVVLFAFLAGDQLYFRTSRGALPMPSADAATGELVSGVTVEQSFTASIQRLEAVSVQFGSLYRKNAGSITLSLVRGEDGAVLLEQRFDAAHINQGQVLTLRAETPLEYVYHVPLVLRIAGDSPAGSGAAALVSAGAEAPGFELRVNGRAEQGMLCFTAEGTDYIWLGRHYWSFSAVLGAILALMLWLSLRRFQRGRRSFLVNGVTAVQKYSFLLRQLVSRDFKIKYKRSVLGVFWSFLNPLLMMTVQFFVFSTLFHSDIPNFAAYLITGTVMFNFFSEACTMTLQSILGNAGLITKVYVPKYIYPLSRTISSVVNLVISLVPMLMVCVLTGVQLKKSLFLSPFFFVCLIVFSLGMGMLLATSMVFFRDTQFLWGVFTMMWMYATPIFYPETILPDRFRLLLQLNPLYHFIKGVRMCILSGISPEPREYVYCALMAAGMLLAGAAVFYRNQNKFVLYL